MNNFQKLFMSKDKKEKLAHITNLLTMAQIDGGISEEEKNCIVNLALRFELTEDEFKQCLADSNEAVVEIPQTDEDKVVYLRNLAMLMMVDGQVTQDEYNFMAYMCDKFGYEESAIQVLVDDIVKEVSAAQ